MVNEKNENLITKNKLETQYQFNENSKIIQLFACAVRAARTIFIQFYSNA